MTASAPGAASPLVGSRARGAREAWIGRLFFAAALVSVVITAFIIFTVFEQAVEFLREDRPLPARRAGLVPAPRACSTSRRSSSAR